jgi:hypothetical protein
MEGALCIVGKVERKRASDGFLTGIATSARSAANKMCGQAKVRETSAMTSHARFSLFMQMTARNSRGDDSFLQTIWIIAASSGQHFEAVLYQKYSGLSEDGLLAKSIRARSGGSSRLFPPPTSAIK